MQARENERRILCRMFKKGNHMKSKIDRLNDALAKGQYGKCHLLIYDILFAFFAGVGLNWDLGVRIANKYAIWILRRRYPGSKKPKRSK